MTLGERIERLLSQKGWSQAELARRIGVSAQSIWKLVTGNAHSSRHLHKIARELGVSAEYLSGETNDPSFAAVGDQNKSDHTAEPCDGDNLVDVNEIDLTFGMGITFMDVPITATKRKFDRAWLRRYTDAKPDQLFFCEGIGNSMEPLIFNHDMLLIDTAQTGIRMSDQIWAIAYGNCGSIKRLRPTPDGAIKMMADNPLVSDETAYDGEIHIIGRVVGVFRKI